MAQNARRSWQVLSDAYRRAEQEIRALSRGATLVMLADDPAFPADVEAWCTKTETCCLTSDAGHYCATVRKEVAG